MVLTIDFESAVPIYAQLKNALIAGMASGELSPGSALPAIRPLGQMLGINMHTVAKAYASLRQEGFVETKRSGSFVAEKFDRGKILMSIQDDLAVLRDKARCAGLDPNALLRKLSEKD